MKTENDFTKYRVTDSLYKKILKELRTNPDGTPKKEKGRPRELTPEMLRNYLFFLSMTGEYESSAENAGLPEKRRQKYMTESESFRGVSSLAKNNLTLRSKIALYKAIEGQLPQYYEITHPTTKEKRYIELKEIPPSVSAAMWHLEKSGAYSRDEVVSQPQLGAPRNEEEAKLLEMILNRHADYVASKQGLINAT